MDENKLLAIVFVALVSCLMLPVIFSSIQDGKTERLELQLKIEQEKTKQIQNEKTDTTTWND